MSQSKFFSNDGYPTSRSTEMSLGDMYARIETGELVVPSYQRKYVWSKRQQDQYFESLRNNFPLSGAVINIDVDTGEQSVMDGQNRLWTIYKYMAGEISFTDEDENVWWFAEIEDSEKRKFKNKKFAYTETTGWSKEQCQNFFAVIQGGTPLKPGEKIHGKPENPLTMEIIHILDISGWFFKSATDGGLGLTDSSMKRYGHYEVIGTIINMVRSGSYPVRPGKTALTEFHHWSDSSPASPSGEERDDCIALVIKLLQRYSLMIINVPTLQKKMKIGQHLRLMYFIFTSEIYKERPDSQYFKIDRLLNKVMNKENPEYENITKWGTTSVDKIYDLYLDIYDSV